jgi:hypothetical protein
VEKPGGIICPMCGAVIPIGTRTCWECGERLPAVLNRRGWPIYVRMGLWMIHSRKVAWRWVWLSAVTGVLVLIIALGAAIYFFFRRDTPLIVISVFVGSLSFVGWGLAAFWYYWAIRWVDQHDTWTKP